MRRWGWLGLGLLWLVALAPLARAQTTTTVTTTTTTTVAMPTSDGCVIGLAASGAVATPQCRTPVVMVDTTAGAVTVTLPSTGTGALVTLSKLSRDGNAMTVQVADTGTETIVAGGSAITSFSNNAAAAIVQLQANPPSHRWFFVTAGTGPTP